MTMPPKILYAAPASPWPAHFGGAMRVAAVLTALERCGEVELVVIADEPGPLARDWLGGKGATLWPVAPEEALGRGARIARSAAAGRSIPAARLAGGRLPARLRALVMESRPDVVILGDTFLAEAAPALQGLDCRIVIDTHNVESLLSRNIASVSSSFVARAAYRLLAANTAALERRVLPLADRVWTASGEDAEWYRENLGLGRVDLVPNVLGDAPALAPPAGGNVVMLSGLFAYPPNEDAALELLAISRELLSRAIDHCVLLVGREPTPRMRRAAHGLGHVEITGAVDSIDPWMLRASVFAAPLRAGSGTKFKLLQAMQAGRAVITTPTGARGLGVEDGRQALVRDREGFADGIVSLFADSQLRTRLTGEARRHVTEHFGQASVDAAVELSLASLGDRMGANLR
jgi:glycosyltransferase involved in cell wall biosynthesis